jgi:glutaredoxin 3
MVGMTPEDRPRVRLYTRRWCGYCIAARRLLSGRGIEFEEIPIDGDPELRRSISRANGNWPTVPMIFIGEHFVGGYRELSRLRMNGELDTLLEGAA